MSSSARSTFGKLTIDSAVVDGSYAAREGQLKQLQITGPDLNVTGQGTIALNESGASNLTVHADTPSLDRVGEIVGQQMKGSAVVDATVTGNARELKASGSLTGSNIGRGNNEALSLKSTFTATVPDLRDRAGAAAGQQHGDVPRDRRPEDQRGHSRHDLFEIAPRVQRCRQRKARGS